MLQASDYADPADYVTNLSEFEAFLETNFATVSDSVQKIDPD